MSSGSFNFYQLHKKHVDISTTCQKSSHATGPSLYTIRKTSQKKEVPSVLFTSIRAHRALPSTLPIISAA